jgi:hypothetical protein
MTLHIHNVVGIAGVNVCQNSVVALILVPKFAETKNFLSA